MEANRAFPRVIWLTLLGTLVSVACFAVLFNGAMAVLLLLLDHHWFRETIKIASLIGGIVSSMAGLMSSRSVQRRNRKQRAVQH
jgi:hypothetical protein